MNGINIRLTPEMRLGSGLCVCVLPRLILMLPASLPASLPKRLPPSLPPSVTAILNSSLGGNGISKTGMICGGNLAEYEVEQERGDSIYR